MPPAEQEMNDYESQPEIKRQDACVTIEERDGESFLSMQESSTKRPKESSLIEEESGTNSYPDPLHISATTLTKSSKVVVKKDTPGQHQVYPQIHSKQDKALYHLEHVMGELPSQVIVDERNSKPSAAISSAGFEKKLTRDEDAIVTQNASAKNQCIDCVHAVVDKTMKKLPPAKVNKSCLVE